MPLYVVIYKDNKLYINATVEKSYDVENVGRNSILERMREKQEANV
jgi:hypothetical protein